MKLLFTVPALALVAITLTACSTSRTCPTGQTAVSLVDGVLVYEPVYRPCDPLTAPGYNGGLSDGPMRPANPGEAWWDF